MATDETITAEVPGIGAFEYSDYSVAKGRQILAEISRITGGVATPTPLLAWYGECVATCKVLCLKAPEGWDWDALDPLDAGQLKLLKVVYGAYEVASGRFRGEAAKPGKATGQVDGGERPPVVSQDVPPAAE